jgi:hypothetical protein
VCCLYLIFSLIELLLKLRLHFLKTRAPGVKNLTSLCLWPRCLSFFLTLGRTCILWTVTSLVYELVFIFGGVLIFCCWQAKSFCVVSLVRTWGIKWCNQHVLPHLCVVVAHVCLTCSLHQVCVCLQHVCVSGAYYVLVCTGCVDSVSSVGVAICL